MKKGEGKDIGVNWRKVKEKRGNECTVEERKLKLRTVEKSGNSTFCTHQFTPHNLTHTNIL